MPCDSNSFLPQRRLLTRHCSPACPVCHLHQALNSGASSLKGGECCFWRRGAGGGRGPGMILFNPFPLHETPAKKAEVRAGGQHFLPCQHHHHYPCSPGASSLAQTSECDFAGHKDGTLEMLVMNVHPSAGGLNRLLGWKN